MEVKYGNGSTEYGPGIEINLTGDELAKALTAYLVAHDVHIDGPRTVRINGDLCDDVRIYVDPSGNVYTGGEKYSGRGPTGNWEEFFTHKELNDIGGVVRLLRKEKNWTHEDLGHEVDLSSYMVQCLEENDFKPNTELRQKLGKVFNLSPEVFKVPTKNEVKSCRLCGEDEYAIEGYVEHKCEKVNIEDSEYMRMTTEDWNSWNDGEAGELLK